MNRGNGFSEIEGKVGNESTFVPISGHMINFENPEKEDMQVRTHPASDLNDAYHLVGRSYDKSRKKVQKTVDILDYAHLYLGMQKRLPDLDALNASLDQFLS